MTTYTKLLTSILFVLFGTLESTAGVYSIVVAVKDYPGGQALHYAANDALLFTATLMSESIGAYDPSKHYLLTDENATPSRIAAATARALRAAGPDDVVIFYYTGHGMHGGLYAYGEDAYYPYQHLRQEIKNSKAGHVLIFIDACESGSIFLTTEKDMHALSKHLATRGAAKTKKSAKQVAIYTSSRVLEQSYESHELGHGVFTYFLCKALSGKGDINGDRYITLSELYRYLRNGTYAYTKKKYSQPQCPLLFGSFSKDAAIAKDAN